MIAVQADVERRLQIDVTAEPDPVITTLLTAAQGRVEGELGRPLEEATHVERFDGLHAGWPRKTLFLWYLPIVSITTVVEGGVTLAGTDYLLYNDHPLEGRLIRVSVGNQIEWRTTKPQGIVVTYLGGYTDGDAPAELVDVVAWMAAYAFQIGAANAVGVDVAGLKSEQIDTYRAEYFGPADHLNSLLTMTEEMRRVVEHYILPGV